jgi:isopropylmalate/homocitrate/citramalate synthase
MLPLLKSIPKVSNTQFFYCNLFSEKFNKIYNQLGCPKPFDVTLRDGLQSLSKEEQKTYTLEKKKELYEKINLIHNPKNIEIGSIVSPRVLPIFSDTLDLFEHIGNVYNKYHTSKNYILIPTKDKLLEVIDVPHLNNFSFITSVSDVFQKKNTKKNLDENVDELNSMIGLLQKSQRSYFNVKLYVSCINECPLSGKINNDIIVDKLLKLNNMNVNNICLSDTCGTLDISDFEYIVDECNQGGVPFSKFSLHLHVKPTREDIVKKIFFAALDRGIIDFDVSLLNTGGCSVTMSKENIAPNLSYDQYYNFLKSYIQTKF